MAPSILIITWFVLPLIVWCAMFCVGRRVPSVLIWILCLVSMIAGVLLLANYVWALDAQLLAEIDRYEPGTPEAQRASDEWASDTDRSFLLLFSPVFTVVWYGFLFLSLFGLQRLIRKMFLGKEASVNSSKDSENIERRDDDGNPYQSPIIE